LRETASRRTKTTRLLYDKRLPNKPTSLGAMLWCSLSYRNRVCALRLALALALALGSLAPQTTMSVSVPLSIPFPFLVGVVSYKLVIFILSNC
jgi:hypothetical protein